MAAKLKYGTLSYNAANNTYTYSDPRDFSPSDALSLYMNGNLFGTSRIEKMSPTVEIPAEAFFQYGIGEVGSNAGAVTLSQIPLINTMFESGSQYLEPFRIYNSSEVVGILKQEGYDSSDLFLSYGRNELNYYNQSESYFQETFAFGNTSFESDRTRLTFMVDGAGNLHVNGPFLGDTGDFNFTTSSGNPIAWIGDQIAGQTFDPAWWYGQTYGINIPGDGRVYEDYTKADFDAEKQLNSAYEDANRYNSFTTGSALFGKLLVMGSGDPRFKDALEHPLEGMIIDQSGLLTGPYGGEGLISGNRTPFAGMTVEYGPDVVMPRLPVDYYSPSQMAGFGLSITPELGEGGYAAGAYYDYTPGQTSNPIFGYSAYDHPDYSPSYNYTGNGYGYDYTVDYSAFDYSFDDVQNYDYGNSVVSTEFNWPIVLDLDGTGLKIDPLSSSNTYFDMAGDGYQHRTAWAGAGNGVLVLDLQGDGQIDQRNEVIFTDWDPTAGSDMQALANVFDTNHNGKLDAGDAAFASFKVLVTNADGTTTLRTLAELGIASIDLIENAVTTILPDGSRIQGQASFTRTDGTTGTAATVGFAYDSQGYAVTRTVTANADGSTTINNKALNPDGSLANETTTVTSANGLSRTITLDNNGDGVADQVQTIVTAVNGDGSRTETLTNKTPANVVLDRTVTTTSADQTSVSITRDSNGNGVTDQTELRTTNADGSTSTIISDLNDDGSLKGRTTTITSIDGYTRTASADLDGNGTTDISTTDASAFDAGARTRTVTVTAPNGELLSRTVTTTDVNGQTTAVVKDLDGDGLTDISQSFAFATGSGGSTVTTETDTSRNGTVLGTIATTISADGLSKTVTVDTDGDGQADLTTSDTTTVNGGTRTQTITETNGDGSLRSQTIIVKGADGRSRTIQTDFNGDGHVDSTETISVDGAGVSTDTISNFNDDGSLIGKTIVTTNASGLEVTTRKDLDGDGTFDTTTRGLTVKNGDGSATTTATSYAANGKVLGTTVVQSSADGLTTTQQSDVNGDGIFDVTIADVEVVNGDGSRLETVTSRNTNGSLRLQSVTSISADRLTMTVTTDANGDGYIDQRRSVTTAANGTTVETATSLNPDNTITAQTKTTVSANGLLRSVQSDFDGDGVFDLTRSDNSVINADGSRTETISDTNANGSLRDRVVIASSADGTTTVTQTDADGNGVFERTTTSNTAFNADGSRTVSTASRGANGVTLGASSVTTSANGLTTTSTSDLNGDGTVDRLGSVTIVQNADGSRIETAEEHNAAGNTLRSQTVTTTSADRLTVTMASDTNGDGAVDQSVTRTVAADGTVTETAISTNPDGSQNGSSQTRTSANGLLTIVATDLNGDLVTDLSTVARTTLNADGSVTVRRDSYVGAGTLIGSETVATSSDGRSVTTTTDIDGDGLADLTKTVVKVVNADGSIVETITEFNQDGSQRDKTVTTTSADGRTIDVSVILDTSGLVKYQKRTTVQNDGSTVTVVTYPNLNGTPIFGSETDTRVTSSDGLSSSTRIINSTNNYYDVTTNTVLNGDGSRTTSYSNANVFEYDVSETVSGNGLNKTVHWTGPSYFDIPELALDGADTTVFNADGSTTRTVTNTIVQSTANTSSVTDRSVTTVSGDGLTTTTQLDINNDGAFDLTESTIKALDGSVAKTVAQYNPSSGALIQKDVLSASFDGRQQTLQRDKNGDGIFEHVEASVTNADGGSTTIITDTTAAGALTDRFVTTVSADGFSKTLSMDVNGDGIVDFVKKTATTINADGTTRTVVTDSLGNGALRDQAITTTSANGLVKTTQYDLNGDGVTDETQTDVTAYLANGTKTQTVTTRYADGTLKDSATTTITQNAYKTVTSTNFDLNGDGVVDRNEITSIDQDGYRLESIIYYSNGASVRRIDTGTSPDGLTTYFPAYVPATDGTWVQVAQETLLLMPHTNGSYFYQTSGSDGQTFIHTIDANNIDNWVWTDPGTITYHTLRINLATEEKLFDEARRLYDTVFDRSMSQAETQKLVKYISADGILNKTGLANELNASTEFTQRYGSLTNTQFIERAFQNAFGRAAMLSELTLLLGQLNNGALTRADLMVQLSESTEHLIVGNEHLVTNNSGVFTATPPLDHSNDKQIIAAIIQNLYDTALDRQATASEVTTQADKILSNAKTEAQVAADILALAEFTTKYGTLTNSAFVAQMFQNALGRAPTQTEQSFWTAALDAATVTRADLLDAIAQSAEHLAAVAKPIGTAGNDIIYSRDGVDIIDGLAGTNTLDYSLVSEPGVNANLALGTGVQANGQTDQFTNIQNLTGTAGADALTGNTAANVLVGGAGNDTLDGGDGNDTLDGGAGDDALTGGAGTDTVSYATAAAGVTVSLGETGAQATGGAGTDTLSGFENLTGSAFNDTLTGSAGTNLLTGGAGNDTYVVQDTTDVVTELANQGIDTVLSSVTYTIGANVENLTLTGTAAINGTGNALDNVITGNAGINTLTGGAGNDSYIVQNTADVVTEAASAGTDTVQSSVSYTIGANVENLTLTGTDAISGTGNTLDNVITGNAGVNILAGGTGNDTYIIQDAGDIVTEAASAGTDTIVSSVSYTISANVENLTLAGTANLSGTGNTLNNVIVANAGDNLLDGGAGTDTVSYAAALSGVTVSLAVTTAQATGGSGADTLTGFENLTGSAFNDTLTGSAGTNVLTGGAGDDIYVIQDATDVVTELAGQGTDTALSSVTYTIGANVENLILTGTAAINGTGNALDNAITGNSGVNTLAGGAGNDTYIVQNTTDVVTEAASAGTDTVQSSVTYTLGSNVENLTLTGTDAISGTGNTLDNILTGNAGVNTLAGGTGNDTYIIQNTTDVVTEAASAGTDTIVSSVSYTISANVENLTLTGSANLNGTGNTLNNVITANSGDNVLDGGTGTDTVSYAAALAGVTVSLAVTTAQATGGSGTETLAGFENLTGSAYNDTLTGAAGANVLTGGAGNDTYVVQDTADVVTELANEGTDRVLSSVTYTLGANVENLTLTGTGAINGTGNDLNNIIVANAGNNVINGGVGVDTVSYATATSGVTVSLASTSAQATGGSGTDTLSAFENIIGSAFNDTLTGSTATNVLTGGLGNDTYIVTSNNDSVVELANEGVDTVQTGASFTSAGYAMTAHVENLTITGTANTNGIGNSLDNVITGNSGNNTLDGGGGNDTLIGGAGNDTYVVNSTLDVVTEAASAGTDTIQSWVTYTANANVENLTLLGEAAINATGNALANTLTGNAGNNVLDGGAGNDTMVGGAGNDTYVVDSTSDVVTEAAGAGNDTILSSVTYTASANVENLTLTGTAAINAAGNTLDNVMTGNAGNNVLDGGGGNDTVSYANATAAVSVSLNLTAAQATGGAGADTLSNFENLTGSAFNDTLTGNAGANILTGGAGDDVLKGLAGADVLDGGDGSDTLDYSNSASGVHVEIWGSHVAEGGDAAGDTFTNIESVTGSAFNDTLAGNSGANVLTGNAGDDILVAGEADDILRGGDGNDLLVGDTGGDVLDGGAGTDTASYYRSSVGVRVELSTGLAQGGDADGDILTGIENLTGSAFNDTLTGNAGANILTGGAGDDVLRGLAGADVLDGGDGSDTLDYSSSASGVHVEIWGSHVAEGGDAAGDTFTNIESVTGSAFNDTLAGNSGANVLTGNAGDDILVAGEADDILRGGDGNDLLVGDTGGDVLDGGAGTDTASYYRSSAGVRVELSTGLAQGGDADGDILTGIENLIGSAFNDTLTGNAEANTLIGGGGNDALDGGAGDDIAVFSGAVANYQITDNGDGSVTVVHLSGGADGTDTLLGIERLQFADVIIDTPQAAPLQAIAEEASENALAGSADADAIHGLGATDTLNGEDSDNIPAGGFDDDPTDADASADNAVVLSANDSEASLWYIGGSETGSGDGQSNLWSSAGGKDLVFSHLGTVDSVLATGWHRSFGGTAAQSESVHAADVNSLISQMAAFSAQVGCDASAVEPSTLLPEYTLAASLPWQANG